MNRKPTALDAYEALAESCAAMVDAKPHNAYYERPTTLSLLPKVEGKRVLEAGCGPGVYADWLAEHGAEVVALDVSPRMVQLAEQRLGAKARVLQSGFSQPLGFLASASFDVVLSALALDYIKDWGHAFREDCRLLRAGFVLERILEPTPTEQSRQEEPKTMRSCPGSQASCACGQGG
jgi:SAM-dependent methyltransferase